MVVWSSLGRACGFNFSKNNKNFLPLVQQCVKFSKSPIFKSEERIFPYTQPSRFQWNKFKDMLHFYMLIGLIPVLSVVFISNVFIGPAQLEPIPEGYEPKYWEYHRHPITRFMVRYCQHTPQQDYEKMMHYLYEEREKQLLRKLEKDIKARMAEKLDYQAYYYRPAITAKYMRSMKRWSEETEARLGTRGDTD